MRILEIETFGRGGLLHYAYNLSGALAERGHRVTLLTSADYELERLDGVAGVDVVRLLARFTVRNRHWLKGHGLQLARSFEALFDALGAFSFARRLQPDVIHFHSTNRSALVYLPLLRRLDVPVVVTAHVVTPHERIRFQGSIYRRLHRLGRLVIAHSEFDRSRLLDEFALDPEGVVVIPHGDYQFFDAGEVPVDRAAARGSLGLGPQDEVILFFGYIREYKGLDVLLEAWPTVVERCPRARLLIAGDPSRLPHARRDELESWAARLGAVSRFEYIPFAEVGRYFMAADVLAMPYRHLSQSGVLYLALSLGLPVVATRVGALPEVLDDGDSALLVPAESPIALAKALVRLLEDSELRACLQRGGRRVVERHSWSSIAAATERAFANLIEG